MLLKYIAEIFAEASWNQLKPIASGPQTLKLGICLQLMSSFCWSIFFQAECWCTYIVIVVARISPFRILLLVTPIVPTSQCNGPPTQSQTSCLAFQYRSWDLHPVDLETTKVFPCSLQENIDKRVASHFLAQSATVSLYATVSNSSTENLARHLERKVRFSLYCTSRILAKKNARLSHDCALLRLQCEAKVAAGQDWFWIQRYQHFFWGGFHKSNLSAEWSPLPLKITMTQMI